MVVFVKLLNFLNNKFPKYNIFESSTLNLILTIIFVIFIYFSSNAIVLDSDSGFEYTNAKNILKDKEIEHGPIVQQFMYALILKIFGFNYKNILYFHDMLSILLILMVLKFIRERINSNITILSALFFFLFPQFYLLSWRLKQYPLFLLFLIFSIYYFDKYINYKKDTKLIILSAIFLGLANMTHLLSVPFVIFILLYYLFNKLKQHNTLTLYNVVTFYLIFLIILFPYIVWRVMMGGGPFLDELLTYPTNWATIKYAKIVNIEFWMMPHPFTFEYNHFLWNFLINWVFLPILIPFLALGFIVYNDKKLVMSWLTTLLVPYIIGRGIMREIYTYPFIPLVVILAAHGIHAFLKLNNDSKRIRILILAIIIIVSTLTMGHTITKFWWEMNKASIVVKDLKEFDKVIPSEATILFRSRMLSPILSQNNILQIGDLLEENAMTYLNWTNDEEVAKVFMKYNISYVVLYKDIRWEKDYYVWFRLVTDYYPKHYYKIQRSPYFEKIKEGKYFTLFKFVATKANATRR